MEINFNDQDGEMTRVMSVEHGLGEIVSLLKLYDGLHDHIEVYFQRGDVTKYYSVKNLNQIRLLSNENQMEIALYELGININSETFCFDSSSYSRGIKNIDLIYIVHTIASLMGKEDSLSENDHNVLEQYLNSLISEVSHVYDIQRAKAKSMVLEYLRCA